MTLSGKTLPLTKSKGLGLKGTNLSLPFPFSVLVVFLSALVYPQTDAVASGLASDGGRREGHANEIGGASNLRQNQQGSEDPAQPPSEAPGPALKLLSCKESW